jgi:hypothetical protein
VAHGAGFQLLQAAGEYTHTRWPEHFHLLISEPQEGIHRR